MRILTVCTSTYIFGAETITLKMLEGFKAAGHDQLAVTTSFSTDGEFSKRLARIGVAETQLPFGAWSKRLAWEPLVWTANTISRLPWLWSGWRKTLRSFQPEVILWTSSRLPVPAYPVIDRTPSFLIEHTHLEPTQTRCYIYRALARKLTGFIAVSQFMADHLVKLGAPTSRIFVVHNGAAFRGEIKQNSYRDRFGGGSSMLRIGIVGQITPNKGHTILIRAVQSLLAKGLELSVFIFGKGGPNYVQILRTMIRAANLERTFHWMGYERDAGTIYKSIDVCVVPSCETEPFGMVAAEAASYGLPVVATRVGGLPEILEDSVTGFIIKPNDFSELALKIEVLAKNPQLRQQMGRAAQARVATMFTVETMIERLEAIFRRYVPQKGEHYA
jgi:glycosyltransferase involved in cell wall biosynthesis